MRNKRQTPVVGQRFGYLTTVENLGPFPCGKSGKRKTRWRCICDCGEYTEPWQESLVSGRSTSCPKRHGYVSPLKGKKLDKPHMLWHGHARGGRPSPTLRSWMSMKARITNPKATGYAHYKALGITICDRWLHGEGEKKPFNCFLEDMGSRPSRSHTIERIDNDGNYEPGNCRWATKKEQARNRRTTLFYEFNGKPHTLKELAAATGIPFDTLRQRLRRKGMPLSDVLADFQMTISSQGP